MKRTELNEHYTRVSVKNIIPKSFFVFGSSLFCANIYTLYLIVDVVIVVVVVAVACDLNIVLDMFMSVFFLSRITR